MLYKLGQLLVQELLLVLVYLTPLLEILQLLLHPALAHLPAGLPLLLLTHLLLVCLHLLLLGELLGGEVLDFPLVGRVLFKPGGEVLNGCLWLLSVDVGQSLGDDLPDGVLLEVLEPIAIHIFLKLIIITTQTT